MDLMTMMTMMMTIIGHKQVVVAKFVVVHSNGENVFVANNTNCECVQCVKFAKIFDVD